MLRLPTPGDEKKTTPMAMGSAIGDAHSAHGETTIVDEAIDASNKNTYREEPYRAAD